MAQTKKFFVFKGSKAEFIAKNYHTTYKECVVHITGGTDTVTNSSGTQSPRAYVFIQGQFLQDPSLIKFVSGVKLNGTNYEISPAGGASLAFANSADISIAYDQTSGAIKLTHVGYTGLETDTTTVTVDNSAHEIEVEVKEGSITSGHLESTIKTEVEAISGLRTLVNEKGSATFSSDVNAFLNDTSYGTSTDKNIVNYVNKSHAWHKLVESEVGQEELITTAQTLSGAINELRGTSTDTKDSMSIEGVRKYVEDKTSGIASEGVVSDLSERVKAIEDAPYATENYVDTQISTYNTNTVTPIKTIVDKLNGADTVNGSVAKALKDAKSYTDELANGQVKTNTDAITVLNGNATTEGSVKYEVAQAVTGLIDGAPAALDTLKELADYIAGDETGAGGLVAEIDANAKAIELLNNTESTTGSVKATAKSYADAAVKSLTEGAIKTNADAIDALDAKTVDGPASSTANHIATFDGTTGKVIKDSGFTIATSVPANAVFTDTTYTGKDGITLNGTEFTNSGVRSVATGTADGTISVNTNGTTTNVAVKGLGSAAYTNSTAYATSNQGATADSALQTVDVKVSGWVADTTAVRITKTSSEVTISVPKDTATTLSNSATVIPSSQLVKNYVDSLWEWEELT